MIVKFPSCRIYSRMNSPTLVVVKKGKRTEGSVQNLHQASDLFLSKLKTKMLKKMVQKVENVFFISQPKLQNRDQTG